MQADAEHQQDDADFGEFVGERLIRREEARRGRPQQHAREQIADQWRNAQPLRDRRQDEGQDEAGDDGRNQRRVMRHILVVAPLALRIQMLITRRAVAI